MRVKCKTITLTDEQKTNEDYNLNQDFHITLNKEYLVFGISFNNNGTVLIEHLTDYGHLVSTPLPLFDIIDNRASKYWVIKKFPDNSITFFPPSFFQEYYHDDLSEREPKIVEDFKQVKKLMEDESFSK